jgi:hypothetical protein
MPLDGGNLQLVGVVFIEGQAEYADAGLVGSDASERFGVVAVDVDSRRPCERRCKLPGSGLFVGDLKP